MVDVFRGRRVENSKLRRAALFFGGGLLKAAFQAWRTVCEWESCQHSSRRLRLPPPT